MSDTRSLILIVDDDENIRMLLSSLLAPQYRVVTQPDGMKAMAWLALGNNPDLILADMEMPEMDGLNLVNYLKISGYHARIPIIVLSSTIDSGAISKIRELGAEAFLHKPFRPKEIFETIEKLLKRAITIEQPK